MEGLDELLTFPSGAEYEGSGGGIDVDFRIILESDLSGSNANIHKEPIILVAGTPQKSTIRGITDFYGDAGLDNTKIIAMNGEAVRKILSNPKDTPTNATANTVVPYVFLNPNRQYDTVDDLNVKQVAFLCLFHQLFFLGKIAKYPSFSLFMDKFPDKFAGVINRLKQEKDRKKSIFGADTPTLTEFWNDLVTSLSMTPKTTLSQALELFEKPPAEIFKYFLAEGAPETVLGGPGENTSTKAGFDEMSSLQGSATSTASSKAPGSIIREDEVAKGLPKAGVDDIEKQFTESGREPAPKEVPAAAATVTAAAPAADAAPAAPAADAATPAAPAAAAPAAAAPTAAAPTAPPPTAPPLPPVPPAPKKGTRKNKKAAAAAIPVAASREPRAAATKAKDNLAQAVAQGAYGQRPAADENNSASTAAQPDENAKHEKTN